MGEVVFQGTTWITFPVEACCTATLRIVGTRYLLLLERETIAAPVWLGPQDAANIIGAMASIMPCGALLLDPPDPFEAER